MLLFFDVEVGFSSYILLYFSHLFGVPDVYFMPRIVPWLNQDENTLLFTCGHSRSEMVLSHLTCSRNDVSWTPWTSHITWRKYFLRNSFPFPAFNETRRLLYRVHKTAFFVREPDKSTYHVHPGLRLRFLPSQTNLSSISASVPYLSFFWRFWELSPQVLICADCGWKAWTVTV